MKVLQINAVYGYKSTGVIVKDIENSLLKAGNESYIAYQNANYSPPKSYKIGNKFDWKWHALSSRVLGRQGYASKLATKGLIKYIKRISPDIVHFHNLHSNYINFNMLCDYLAECQIPVVITLHDCWYFTGKCTHYASVKCEKWQHMCGNCPLNKLEQASLFFDVTSSTLKDKVEHLNQLRNLTLVGCSEWITNEARKSLLKANRITTIYNGIDIDIFKPHVSNFKEKNGLDSRFTILGIANKWCLDINRYVTQSIIYHNQDCNIVVIGCSQSEKDMFKEYKNVTCLGYINDRNELSDIYSACDVFINPTHADTLPTVNMESICCGTPVITYNCCGSPELIDNDCGFVVEENDIDLLLSKIDIIKNNPLIYDIKNKQKRYDNSSCYDKYLDLYIEILKQKK